MRWIDRASVMLAPIGFFGLVLGCGDDVGTSSMSPDSEENADAQVTTLPEVTSNVGTTSVSESSKTTAMDSGLGSSMPDTAWAEAGIDAATTQTMSSLDEDAATNAMPTLAWDAGDSTDGSTFDPELPPTEPEAMAAWLAGGYYLDWACEGEPNAKTEGASAIHVHGAKTRVCANELLAGAPVPRTDATFPAGVAAVKEVFGEDDNLLATVVSVKTAADSDGGNNWYWYMNAETQGFGIAGCAGCHSAAGSDIDHPGAGDFVYFHVTEETD